MVFTAEGRLPHSNYSKRLPKNSLYSAVTTSRFTSDLHPTSHAAAEVLDDVGKVADGVAVGNEVPAASSVAVVVKP
jgi:hypothetical protein